jgi:hypothetical protein
LAWILWCWWRLFVVVGFALGTSRWSWLGPTILAWEAFFWRIV